MITKIYHKKNELFEIEFFKNAGCTDPFEFLNEKSLYIKLNELKRIGESATSNRL